MFSVSEIKFCPGGKIELQLLLLLAASEPIISCEIIGYFNRALQLFVCFCVIGLPPSLANHYLKALPKTSILVY